jgi:two-component system, response regulator PdtaR
MFDAAQTAPSQAMPSSQCELVSMKILIVEDEVILALSMDEALSDSGHEVVGLARDIAGATKIAAAEKPQLALIDLKLARGASGALLAQYLRERFGIPAIFVSGNPADCKAAGIHGGVLGCLAKPFFPDQLVDAVEVASTMLRRQHPTRVPPNMELYYVM